MVRILAGLVGLGFATALLCAVLFTSHTKAPESAIAMFHKEPREVEFESDGVMGKFDHAQLQRGFQVYKEICANCHSLKQVAFADLKDMGYTTGQIKGIAADWAIPVPTYDAETGDAKTRKAIPADKMPSPYANEAAARNANGHALPPDLSLITKAREEGPAYVYSLLTGYEEVPAKLPADNRPAAGLHYNPYFANLNLAMAQQITTDGQVTYAPGNPPATKDQMAKDVTAFLIWAAEPNLERRHNIGLGVMGFLAIFALLCWMSYKSIWADKKKH
jgi:ubiquinol-cytochrome c reductase cytochrome c1 subunit